MLIYDRSTEELIDWSVMQEGPKSSRNSANQYIKNVKSAKILLAYFFPYDWIDTIYAKNAHIKELVEEKIMAKGMKSYHKVKVNEKMFEL